MKFLWIVFLPACLLGLHINIFAPVGKFGLTNDIKILTEELTLLGHTVHVGKKQRADVNIHLQSPFYNSFLLAKINYLIPNPDWFAGDTEKLTRFDKILCKTREGERIFKAFNPNTTFISFTSQDHFDGQYRKNIKGLIHSASSSHLKGSRRILATWENNPGLPLLTLINPQNLSYPPMPNLFGINEFLPLNELIRYHNEQGIHLCLSETEGFGHYIFEALSCGAVVITTDAPPMNEFVKDPRCLVSYKEVEPHRLANRYFFEPEVLIKKIEELLLLPEEELEEIGKRNREFYLENNRFFKRRLRQIFADL